MKNLKMNFQFSTLNFQLQRGFTFIELVLYVAIVSVITVSLVTFAWNVIGIGTKSSVEQEVISQARYVSERIKYEIRSALNINTGTSNFSVNLATNPGAQLSLQKSSPNNPTIIDVTTGKVRIRQGSTPTPYFLQSNNTNVTNLTFTNYTSSDNKTKHVGFTMTLTALFGSQKQEFRYTTTLESSAEIRSN